MRNHDWVILRSVPIFWKWQLSTLVMYHRNQKLLYISQIKICLEQLYLLGRYTTYLKVNWKWCYCFDWSTVLNFLWKGQSAHHKNKSSPFHSHSFIWPHQTLMQRKFTPSENILNVIKLKAAPKRLFFLARTHKQSTWLEEKVQRKSFTTK